MASTSSATNSPLASFTVDSPSFRQLRRDAAAPRRRSLTVRAHSRFPDQGSSDAVDANLGVLRDRIEAVQIKERLELTCSAVLRSTSLRMMTRSPPPPPQSTSATCSRVEQGRNDNDNKNYGWNYGGDEQLVMKSRRRSEKAGTFELVYQVFRLAALVSSTVGVTCLSGTCLLYLVSIFTHHFGHY
ncbi:unnamed protein product [Linum trigynum]